MNVGRKLHAAGADDWRRSVLGNETERWREPGEPGEEIALTVLAPVSKVRDIRFTKLSLTMQRNGQ